MGILPVNLMFSIQLAAIVFAGYHKGQDEAWPFRGKRQPAQSRKRQMYGRQNWKRKRNCLRKGLFMDAFAQIHKVSGLNKVAVLFDEDSKAHANHHPPTLDDVQRRAFEIHHEHGAVNGGYTLDEWLEAEHELEGTDGPDSGNDLVH
jgi:hypothetical protein